MTRQTYGNYIEFSKPIDPDKVPQMFKAAYGPLLSAIKRRGGKPLPESIRIYIVDAIGDQLPGRFGLKMDADFAKKSALEEINDKILSETDNSSKRPGNSLSKDGIREGKNERETGGKGGGE